MQSHVPYVLVATLVLASIIGISVSVYIALRTKRITNFCSLMLFNYVAVMLVSGVIHLGLSEDSIGGYVDIRQSIEEATVATVGSVVGLTALIAGLMRNRRRTAGLDSTTVEFRSLSVREHRFILPLALTLLIVSSYALLVVRRYSAQLGDDRIITLPGGLARYNYLSQWFIWAVAILVVLFIYSRRQHNTLGIMIASLAAIFLIAASLMWTGGRSIVVLMTLPLLLVILPRLKSMRWLMVLVFISAGIVYILNVTSRRIGESSSSGVMGWLDWQWGRFSMLGWASTEVDNEGWLFGETIALNVVNTILGAFRLLGIHIASPEWQSVLAKSGESILRDPDAVYIVPGLVSELYMNFGYPGIGLGMYVLGRLTKWVDWKLVNTQSVVIGLFYAYVGSLLIFRTVSADSGALVSYLLFTGFPLIAFAAISVHLLGTRGKRVTSGCTPVPTRSR